MIAVRVMMLAVNLEDDPLAPRQQHQEVHPLPEQNTSVREAARDLRIVMQVNLWDQRRQPVTQSFCEIAEIRLEELLLGALVKRCKKTSAEASACLGKIDEFFMFLSCSFVKIFAR